MYTTSMEIIMIALTIITRTFTDISFKASVHIDDAMDMHHKSAPIRTKKVIKSGYFWLGLLLGALHVYSWLICLKKFDLSFMYPMLSVSYVCIMVTGRFLFNETLDKYKITGMAIITLGSIILAKSV